MSGALSIQHKDDKCGCCDAFGSKQRKQQANFDLDDADLAKEMNEMSFEEREKALEDLHGVSAVQEETPELIQTSIEAFDAAVTEIPAKHRKAYNKALFLKPAIQKDTKLKLQFLRAEEFNAVKAAERMIKFFGQKLDLFGEEKLVKRLTLDDLEEAEVNLFKIGYMTMLPFRDSAGRPILFGDGTKLNFDIMTIDNIVRCFFYLKVSCFEDEVSQKKGLCIVIRFSGGRRSVSKSRELAEKAAYNSYCCPGRITSFHICYNDPAMHLIISTLRWAASGSTRVRTRTHYGSEVENDYNLLTFGIPSQSLLQKAKAGTHTLYDEYIQRQREADEKAKEKELQEEARTGIIAYPQPKDILTGRGAPFRDLPCNAVWVNAIQDKFDLHRDSSAFEKNCISMVIVKTMNAGGSRFLERNDDGWKEVSEEAARKKTASAFRNKANREKSAASSARSAKHPASHLSNQMPSNPAAKRQRFDSSTQQRGQNGGLFLRW